MKKIAFVLLFAFTLTNAYAQGGFLGRLKKQNNQSGVKEVTTLGIPLTLDIGIDTHEVPLAGSPGSQSYREGMQDVVRKSTSTNRDATRYLTNAVEENNTERVSKLLDAGASAYIDYAMIDNRQYEIMDLMYKNNPMLIRFSQLLHYACAHSDSTMVDFLIDRGASLDLCGNYFEKVRDPYLQGWLARKRCAWNSDPHYFYTPQDVTLFYGNSKVREYIINKYNKYPTAFGYAHVIYSRLSSDSKKNDNVDVAISLIKEGIATGDDYNKSVKTILNTPEVFLQHHGGGRYNFSYNYLLAKAIERLGEYRRTGEEAKAAKFEQVVRLMIEKGADVNVFDVPTHSFNTVVSTTIPCQSPLLAAMHEPNMLDIIKLLIESGASKTATIFKNGNETTIPIKDASIRDEYKELLIIGEL